MPRITSTLTHESLLENLHYDPDTGIFTRIKKCKGSNVGEVSGSITQHGYLKVGVDRYQYYAHRLAWFYVHGQWPGDVIDHIDRNKKNNRIENLRDVSQVENGLNKSLKNPINKSCGLIGVHYNRQNNKWCAQIKHKQQKIYLGLHDTPEQAQAAYLAAKKHIFDFGFYSSPWMRTRSHNRAFAEKVVL